MIQFRAETDNNTANATLGNIKFTWYVRFHGRTRPAVVAKKGLPIEDNEACVSMMSYAELQAAMTKMQTR